MVPFGVVSQGVRAAADKSDRRRHLPGSSSNRQRGCDLSATAHTPYLHLEGGRMWFMKKLIRLLGVVFQVDEECP
jgi:hypothetical protein